jgi:hypothetical protein
MSMQVAEWIKDTTMANSFIKCKPQKGPQGAGLTAHARNRLNELPFCK